MKRLPAVLLAVLLFGGCGDEASRPTPRPTSTAESPQSPVPDGPPDLGAVRVRLEPVATLTQPLAMAVRDEDPALYVAQKTGQVVALRDGQVETILDLSGEVSQGGEQGLLGLAFSPSEDFLYLNFTDVNGDTRIVEYAVGARLPRDIGFRREILFVDQPFSNHNGGNLVFGPDGLLYIGLGDGGGAGDPEENAQDLGVLLGKMLRINPFAGRPYRAPPDNPFVGVDGARPEIWAFGLRNPWRYSFDRKTGDLWIADVGQNAIEEIDFQPGSSRGGENYGWDPFEGTAPFEGQAPPDAIPPIHEYDRSVGSTIIGGYVYRGDAIPELRGAYLFGDFFSPELMALTQEGGRLVDVRGLGVNISNLSSFGEDLDGELYALSLSGEVFRLAPA